MKLIIGLGNPGKKYENSRHNIGFRIVENFIEKNNFEISPKGPTHNAITAEKLINDEQIVVIKPLTFMNLSGPEVASRVNYHKLDPSKDIIVCYDDKDMLFGKLRERQEGRAGGHNGIKSIIKSLGTENFHRLKFGVGHEDQKIPTDAFVLQKFTEEEEEQIPSLIKEAQEKIEKWLK